MHFTMFPSRLVSMCVCIQVYIIFQKLGMEQENIILPCNPLFCLSIQCKVVGARDMLAFQMFPLYTIREVKVKISAMTN